MKNILLSIGIILMFISCDTRDNVNQLSEERYLPRFMIENDSLIKKGTLFSAKLYLSDTSLLRFQSLEGKPTKFAPIISVGKKKIKYNSSVGYALFQIDTDTLSTATFNEPCIIVFPHPIFGEGDIYIMKTMNFTVID